MVSFYILCGTATSVFLCPKNVFFGYFFNNTQFHTKISSTPQSWCWRVRWIFITTSSNPACSDHSLHTWMFRVGFMLWSVLISTPMEIMGNFLWGLKHSKITLLSLFFLLYVHVFQDTPVICKIIFFYLRIKTLLIEIPSPAQRTLF